MMPKKILLFDDVVHSRAAKESKLEGFASRLRNQEQFQCEAILAVDERGFRLTNLSDMEMGLWFKELIIGRAADGVVVDLDWWGDPVFGEKIWQSAKSHGLELDSRCVVFISEHASVDERKRIVDENALQPNQVVYRNSRGFDIAAQWLKEHV